MEEETIDLKQLPIAVDVMGGDHGPDEIVLGAIQTTKELGLGVVLVGDEVAITSVLKDSGELDNDSIQIKHASQVITMEDSASAVLRAKKDNSISVAFQLVKDGLAAGVVSPGNTGAMMAAGRAISGTFPAIGRPAIATLIPRIGSLRPVVLLDSGANVDCHATQLVQFALMGSCYASAVADLREPRVALLSNGTESSKGNDVTRSTAFLLSNAEGINYVGYVEGRDIASDIADVVVCDGFTGNIVLKTMEGSVELVFDSIRDYVERSYRGKLGMWLAKPVFKSLFREKLDPSSHGGAPLLGLNDVAIVCHGSSKSRAIVNAVRVARKFADEGLVNDMREAIDSLDATPEGVYEDGLWDRMGQRFEKQKKTKKKVAESSEESKEVFSDDVKVVNQEE